MKTFGEHFKFGDGQFYAVNENLGVFGPRETREDCAALLESLDHDPSQFQFYTSEQINSGLQ